MADRDYILEKHFPTPAGSEDAQAIKDAMDEYMEATCLELLEYMANQTVDCRMDDNDKPVFIVGSVIRMKELTKEQLFENFL